MLEKRKREMSPPVHKCRWDYCTATFATFNDWEIHFEVDHMSTINAVDLTGRYKRQKADGRWYVLPVGEGFHPSQELPLDVSQSTGGDITMSTIPSLRFSQPQFSQPQPSQLTASMAAQDCMPTHMILPPRSSPERGIAELTGHGGAGPDGSHGPHVSLGEHVDLGEAGDHRDLRGLGDPEEQDDHDMGQYLVTEAELDAAGHETVGLESGHPELNSESQSQSHPESQYQHPSQSQEQPGDIQNSLESDHLGATPPDPSACNLSPPSPQHDASQPPPDAHPQASQPISQLASQSASQSTSQSASQPTSQQNSHSLPPSQSLTDPPSHSHPFTQPENVYPKLPSLSPGQSWPSNLSMGTLPFPAGQRSQPTSPAETPVRLSSSQLPLSHIPGWRGSSGEEKGSEKRSQGATEAQYSQGSHQRSPGGSISSAHGKIPIEFGSAESLEGEGGMSPAKKRAGEKIAGGVTFGFGQGK